MKYTLRELAVDHDYYCSDNNYYSNEAALRYNTFEAFYDEFNDADVDMNLVFRRDIKPHDNGPYYLELFMMKQRKGIFTPIMIETIEEKDIPNFIKYITPHLNKLQSIWEPLTFKSLTTKN